MVLDFRSCIYRNEWSFKGRLTTDFEAVQESQCFSPLTINTMRGSTKIDNCVFKMYFNTLNPYKTFRGRPYSNISFFSLDQYREYIQLVQDYIPKFTWELIEDEKESINLIGQKHCIVLNMKDINKTEFLFIITMIRYGYEYPSSPYMPQVLQLYHTFNGELDIVNCTNVVLGANQATHGHETQCLFPYLSNGIPALLSRKFVLTNLRFRDSLYRTFNWLETSRKLNKTMVMYNIIVRDREPIDLEKWDQTIAPYLCCYINYINKWLEKYSL